MKYKIATIMLLVFLLLCLGGCFLLDQMPNGKKVQLTEEMVVQSPISNSNVPVYTGSPIELDQSKFSFKVGENFVDYNQFDYTYKNNTNAGENTAELTITAKDSNPYCYGSVTLKFSIVGQSARADNTEQFVSLVNNTNVDFITVYGDITIEQDVTVTVRQNASVVVYGACTVTVLGNFVNNGTFILRGQLGKCYLKNYGSVQNNGSFSVESNGTVLNNGSFTSQSKVKNNGAFLVNDNPVDFVEYGQYVRQPADQSNARLVDDAIEYTTGAVIPAIICGGNFQTEYFNNTSVGEASVVLTFEELDSYYYGTITLSFTILPGRCDVSSWQGLVNLQQNGNYNRYFATAQITVPQQESFTLKQGETLDLMENSLIVAGNLVNNGQIVGTADTTRRHGEMEVSGKLQNNGEINLPLRTLNGSGEIISYEGSAFAFNSLSSSGSLTVGGTLSVEEKIDITAGRLEATATANISCSTLNLLADAVLDGQVSVTTLALGRGKSLENSGKLTFVNGSFQEETLLKNGRGATWEMTGRTDFADMNLVNEGKIINSGDLFCEKISVFQNPQNGFDNAQGSIWSYDSMQNVSENIVVKQVLSAENVSLEYDEVAYDKLIKRPKVSVDGQLVSSDNFTVEYLNEAGDQEVTNPKTVGTYCVRITVITEKFNYGRSYTATYKITYGALRAETNADLLAGLVDKNYNSYTMLCDGRITSGRITLEEYATLDTNGFSLTISSGFSNRGRMIVQARTNSEDFGLLITDSGSFYNYGTLENYDVICVSSSTARFSQGENDIFQNDGVVYCVGFIRTTAESTGTVWSRKILTADELALSQTEYTYQKGVANRPDVLYTGSYDADDVPFSVYYSNNIHAGTATAKVTPDLFNKYYVDSVQLPFTINKAVFEARNIIEMTNDIFQNPNDYSEFRLMEDITSSGNITIPSGILLNFSCYTWIFGPDDKVFLQDDTELIASANDVRSLRQNIDCASKITLTADITGLVEFSFEQGPHAHYFRGNRAINVTNVVIDLNGHSISGGIKISNNAHSNLQIDIINSQEDATCFIGNSSMEYGFEQVDCNEQLKVNITNATIWGIKIYGHNSGGGIVLHCTDCTVKNTTNYAMYVRYINANTTMDNCKFETDNQVAIFFNSGTHYLNNCTLSPDVFNGNFTARVHRPIVYVNGVLYVAS